MEDRAIITWSDISVGTRGRTRGRKEGSSLNENYTFLEEFNAAYERFYKKRGKEPPKVSTSFLEYAQTQDNIPHEEFERMRKRFSKRHNEQRYEN